jgi:hypothetical protein
MSRLLRSLGNDCIRHSLLQCCSRVGMLLRDMLDAEAEGSFKPNSLCALGTLGHVAFSIYCTFNRQLPINKCV